MQLLYTSVGVEFILARESVEYSRCILLRLFDPEHVCISYHLSPSTICVRASKYTGANNPRMNKCTPAAPKILPTRKVHLGSENFITREQKKIWQ